VLLLLLLLLLSAAAAAAAAALLRWLLTTAAVCVFVCATNTEAFSVQNTKKLLGGPRHALLAFLRITGHKHGGKNQSHGKEC
jgi:hypothetical protein